MGNRLVVTMTFGAALAAAACGSKSSDADKPAAPADSGRIVVDAAQRARFGIQPIDSAGFSPTVLTTGTVAFSADRSTQILAPMSGPVTRILVSPGQQVRAGQALATVSSPDFAAAVAGYGKAHAVWRNAQRIADLDEKLFANDALARRELEQARTDLLAAAADRDAALQQLKTLGVDSAAVENIREGKAAAPVEAAIRTPIAGTLVEKLVTPGQLIQAGSTPTFTVADLSVVWVLANVFEKDLRDMHRGEAVAIVSEASPDTLTGTVDYIASLVDPATKATSVRVVVPNKGTLLKRDMLVQVSIQSASKRRGLLVPVAAVLRDDENLPYLFVAMPDNSFARRRIELGARVANRYEVTSGLTAGEKVVVDGALFLQAAGQ